MTLTRAFGHASKAFGHLSGVFSHTSRVFGLAFRAFGLASKAFSNVFEYSVLHLKHLVVHLNANSLINVFCIHVMQFKMFNK